MYSSIQRLHMKRNHNAAANFPWWRHQLETFSALLDLCAGNSPVTGEFPSQRPLTWSFGVIFVLRLNKRLSKQSRRRCFETPSRSYNDVNVCMYVVLNTEQQSDDWEKRTVPILVTHRSFPRICECKSILVRKCYFSPQVLIWAWILICASSFNFFHQCTFCPEF